MGVPDISQNGGWCRCQSQILAMWWCTACKRLIITHHQALASKSKQRLKAAGLPLQVWMALLEKQVDFAVVFIHLYNKPDWYKELVPTTLVPALDIRCGAQSRGIVYESLDILKVGDCPARFHLHSRWAQANLMPRIYRKGVRSGCTCHHGGGVWRGRGGRWLLYGA